jgi:predicted ABC-type ATPase
MDAIAFSDRAYVFDNSGENKKKTWIAEVTDGNILSLHQPQVPAWFKRAVLDKV